MPPREPAMRLPVRVAADTSAGFRLQVPLRVHASVWLAEVTPSRLPAPSPPLPEVGPGDLPPLEDSAPSLQVDPGLKPPILRGPGVLTLAAGRRQMRASVELEVRVDESGLVREATWAGGSTDSMLVEAARRCALGMRFHPALRAGRPVAVWCRQRFDFGEAAR